MQLEVKPQRDIDFRSESDYDLIGYMSMRLDDPLGAQEAWVEFYRRHSGYLFGHLKSTFDGLFDELCVQDFAKDTLIIAHDKAQEFRQNENVDAKQQRWHVRAWLGKIARNLLLTEFRKQDGFVLLHPDGEEMKSEGESDDQWDRVSHEVWRSEQAATYRNPAWEARRRLMEEGLETLSEAECFVLRVTVEYDRPQQAHQRLPNKISRELASALSTTPENVRQIRKRAKKKIKEYFQKKE